jgi:hypothetical protein
MHDLPLESLQLAKHWLVNCTKTHLECSPWSSNWYPSRLLELNAPESGKCRLVHTEATAMREPYMTLSHCWGNAQFLKLTTDSLSGLTKGIATSRLPHTFQDAVKVVLQFDVKYLWIDSLCIKQDDHEDWVRESSVMGDGSYSQLHFFLLMSIPEFAGGSLPTLGSSEITLLFFDICR